MAKKLSKLQEKEFLLFLEDISFSQPMDCMCICFELTDSKVISAPLSVKNCESAQEFCRFGTYIEVLPPLRMSSRTKQCVSQWMIFHEILSFLNFGESLSEIQVSLKFHKMAGALL